MTAEMKKEKTADDILFRTIPTPIQHIIIYKETGHGIPTDKVAQIDFVENGDGINANVQVHPKGGIIIEIKQSWIKLKGKRVKKKRDWRFWIK